MPIGDRIEEAGPCETATARSCGLIMAATGRERCGLAQPRIQLEQGIMERVCGRWRPKTLQSVL